MAASGSSSPSLVATSSSSISSADPSSSTLPLSVAPPDPTKKKLQGWQHSAAGSLGGMAGAIVTSPFDVVKTRLQSDLFRHSAQPIKAAAEAAKSTTAKTGVSGTLYQFVDTVYLIRRIGVEEGWKALYKGLGPSLVGIIPARAINFYFYPTSKAYLAKQFPNAPTEQAGQTAEDSPVIHLSAAVIAGIMTATGTNPIWVVKTRLQLSARRKESPLPPSSAVPTPASAAPSVGGAMKTSSILPGPIARSAAALASQPTQNATAPTAAVTSKSPLGPAVNMTMDILKKDGIRGLYRGLSASYLGVSEGVIQWVLYERLKRLSTSTSPDRKQSLISYMGSIVGASGGAKAVASLITYPHEVVRTRLRQPAINGVVKYTGLLQTLKLVLKEEGVASLYGGLTAHMFRVVPNAACMFLIYELVAGKLGQ
ncbi:solute carrier family 25, member 33/36 [Kwoniella heveanensis CBS 569]|nr:solute carrier family 25, member 33/36 [Kwoniella heveanensis CBS 569]